MKKRIITLGVFLITVFCGTYLHAEMIDFEDLPLHTFLGDQYISRGLRVLCTGMYCGYAQDLGEYNSSNFGNSPTRIVNLGMPGVSIMTLKFVTPENPYEIIGASSVSFITGDGHSAEEKITVTYYDTKRSVLRGPTEYTTTTEGIQHSVSSSELGGNIGYIEIKVLNIYPLSGCCIDDIEFELASKPAEATISIDFEDLPVDTRVRDHYVSEGLRISTNTPPDDMYCGRLYYEAGYDTDNDGYAENDNNIFNYDNSPVKSAHTGWPGEDVITLQFVNPENPDEIIGASYVRFVTGDGHPDLEKINVTYYDPDGSVLRGPTEFTMTTEGIWHEVTSSELGGNIGSVKIEPLVTDPLSGCCLDDISFVLAPKPKTDVKIYVYDADTGEPIQGAEVTVGEATGITDSGGDVSFNSFTVGDYELSIQAAGYNTLSREVTIQADDNIRFLYGLTPEEDNTDVKINVYDTDTGESIPGAEVTVGDTTGITDSGGDLTFYSFTVGDYELSIQADGYNTLSSDVTIQAKNDITFPYGLTPEEDSDEPGITDVVSSYSSKSREAFFLQGTSFPLSFTANIDWNGKTPYSVQFITPNETYTQIITSDEDLKITLDMGNDFNPGGRLSVIAEAEDGTRSAPFDANIEVMPQIFGTQVFEMPFKKKNGTFSYNREVELGTFIFTPQKEITNPVPDNIPFFGGKEPEFKPAIKFDVSIEGNVATYMFKRGFKDFDGEMEILGRKVKSEISIGGQLIFHYSPDNDSWALKDTGILIEPSLSADLIKAGPHYYPLPTPITPIPIYLRCSLGASIEGSVNIQGFNFYENDWSLSGRIEPALKGSVSTGVGIADILGAEGILGANASFATKYDTGVEPEGVTIAISGSVNVYYMLGSFPWPLGELWYYHWPDDSHIPSAMTLKSINLRSAEWLPMPRDYTSGLMKKSLLDSSFKPSLSLESYTVDETVIPNQTDIFKYSYPTMTNLGDKELLVWITDDGAKTDFNRTSLLYSVYSDGTWMEPVKILENGTTDFYPELGSVTSGAWLTWQDSDTVFVDSGVELSEMSASQEIAVAFYNSATDTWGSQVDMSSNDCLDRSPVLATSGNSALLCWVSNEANDILGSVAYPNTLMYALHDGTTWSSPATIATGLGTIVRMDLLYDAVTDTGTLVYSLDADSDISTVEDQELYAVNYTSSAWGSPVQLTDNSVQDTNPQLAFNSNGDILMIWYQDGIILQAVDLDISGATTVIEGTASNGSADFTLTTGAGGQVNLLWPDASDQGQDLYLALYDSTLQLWSKPLQITETEALERSVTAVVDSNNDIIFVYNRVNMTTETQQVEVGGSLVDIEMPVEQSTDLCSSVLTIEGDLAVASDEINITPSVLMPGQYVEFSLGITNNGLSVSENTTVDFYYGDPAADGIQIGESVVLTDPLVPGDTATVSETWQVPDTPDETRAIHAVIDGSQIFEDKDRTNNSISTPVFFRELEIGQLFSQQIGPNIRMIVIVVENNGAFSCFDIPVEIQFNETTLYEGIIGTLDPGKTVEVTYEWDVSGISSDEDGYLSIEVAVNSSEVIDEVNYLNNTRPGRVLGQTIDGSVFEDTDLDLMDDNWELDHFGDLTTANYISDYDRDGYSDLQEYFNYTEGRLDPGYNIFNPTIKNTANGYGYTISTDVRRKMIGPMMLLLDD